MTDYFVLLGQPRQPWLDPEAIQTRFLALSEGVHPDRVHEGSAECKSVAHDQFADLNAACQCLRDPKRRLRHLLELELGHLPAQLEQVPADAADFYFKAGQLCRHTDQFLAQKEQARSPLTKAKFFGQSLEWVEQLNDIQAILNTRRNTLEQELKDLNSAWEAAPPVGAEGRAAALPLERLERVYRELSYVARWNAQIGERLVRLSL